MQPGLAERVEGHALDVHDQQLAMRLVEAEVAEGLRDLASERAGSGLPLEEKGPGTLQWLIPPTNIAAGVCLEDQFPLKGSP